MPLLVLLLALVIPVVWAEPIADVKRADAAQAIVNYQAQLAETERQRALMEAPGTAHAVNTGQITQKYVSNSANFSALLSGLAKEAEKQQLQAAKADLKLLYFQNKAGHWQNIDVSSLLGQKRLGSQAEVDVATQVITNLTNPFPQRMSMQLATQLRAASLEPVLDPNAPPKLELPQQLEYVERQMVQAAFSVAQRSFYEMMAMRLPISPEDATITASPSLLETMEQESTWRIQSPEWFNSLATTPKEGLLRELAQMEAMRLWIQYQQYRQSERTEALLATLLSGQTRLNGYLEKILAQAENAQARAGG
jgi:hypothetical protein